MGYNFPSSPSNGHVHWAGGGYPTYVYSSTKGAWTRRAGTANPFNYFVNPCMHINDQNGLTDGSNVVGLTMAEQYFVSYTTSVGVYRGQRLAITTPGGSKHRLRLSITTPDPTLDAGDWLAIYTKIEGNRMAAFAYGTAGAKWGVLRFGWKAPAGTYCVAIRNTATTRSYVYPFTISAGLANTDTVIICIVPPCVDGAWVTDNTSWAFIHWIVTNASYTSTLYQWVSGNFAGANTLTNTFYATAGNTAELFDVGFYLDPNITGIAPEFQPTHIEDDYVDCLRYWYPAYGQRGIISSATVANRSASIHPVPMRTTPSVSMVGTTLRAYDGTATPNCTSVTNVATTAQHLEVNGNVASGLTVGRRGGILTDGVTTNYVAVNARL